MNNSMPFSSLVEASRRAAKWLDGIPYTLLAIPLRIAVAMVFWNSGTTKLPNWDMTVALFTDEYQVPLLPPELAAYMAATIELTTPVMLVLGLLTRPATAILLGMTVVIQIFVYPMAWPTHIQWAAMLLVLLARGPGKLSLDWLIWRRALGSVRSEAQAISCDEQAKIDQLLR
jgi:putative oxidoreductase